jgi:hypothetical protein
MMAARAPQKAASGWPPVVGQNLRTPHVAAMLPKQKSRRAAAPRRSGTGTCEKPPPDAFSLPRAQETASPLSIALAAAETVTLFSRHAVHLHTGLHNDGDPLLRIRHATPA